MRVCPVCGAMQSITDTDKRLSIHLEGKIHIGYQRIRKLHQDLNQELDILKRQKTRLRTPTPPQRNQEKRKYDLEKKDGGYRAYFSSCTRGVGTNMPDQSLPKLADQALKNNKS